MSVSKERFSTQLPAGLADEVRHLVVDLQRAHPGVTLSSFTADALIVALEGVRTGTFHLSTGSPLQLRPGRSLTHSTGMSASVVDEEDS